MEIKIIDILYLLAFLLIIIFHNRKVPKYDGISLPDHFLKLNSQQRKKALDFAWKFGYKNISSLPISSGLRKIGTIFLGLLTIIINGLSVYGSILILSQSLEFVEKKTKGVWFAIILYSIGILLLLGFFRSLRKAKESSLKDKAEKEANEKLQKLGIQFVQENVSEWILAMDQQTRPKAINESSTKPDATFFLASQDLSLRSSGMPSKMLGVTYIFSNGYMSAISNIVFDIEQTSYSYVDSQSPVFHTNKPQDWTIEEFHYKDVIEFNYKPKESGTTTVKSAESNFPIDGYLHLGLVNGSKKEYPTSKKDVSNFLSLAREKVRATKG